MGIGFVAGTLSATWPARSHDAFCEPGVPEWAIDRYQAGSVALPVHSMVDLPITQLTWQLRAQPVLKGNIDG